MFREGINLPIEHINVLFTDGGLGDAVFRMPAIRYINRYYKHVIVHLWVPDYFLELACNILPENNNLIIRDFTTAKKKYNNKLTGIDAGSRFMHTSMRTHLVDHAFNVIIDKDVPDEEKESCKLTPIDVSKFNLPEKFVVVSTGYTAVVREMIPETVNDVVKYVKSKGYEVVFLGNRFTKTGAHRESIVGNFKEEVDFNQGLDLVDKTSLLEAGSIINKSKVFVGLDNGLACIGSLTDIPLVVGFTTVQPELRLPYRRGQLGWNCYPVVPDESLTCRFCQSQWNFVFDHDFRECYYVEKGYDKEIQCTKNLTADKYIKELGKVL